MTQPNYQLGIKCKLLTNTGSYNSPVWTAISGISDFELNPEWNTQEGSTRGSQVIREAKTQMKLSVTGKVKVDPTDTNGWVALLAALNSYTPLDLLVMRGDPTDSTLTGTLTGYRCDWHVKKMGESQSLGDVL